jgi:hypothetical protein
MPHAPGHAKWAGLAEGTGPKHNLKGESAASLAPTEPPRQLLIHRNPFGQPGLSQLLVTACADCRLGDLIEHDTLVVP